MASELETTAYHEAGHAILLHHFGGKNETLNIIDQNAGHIGDKVGTTKWAMYSDNLRANLEKEFGEKVSEKSDNLLMWSLLKRIALPFLGGIAATYIYDAKREKRVPTGDAAGDVDAVKEMIADVFNLNWSDQDVMDWCFNDAVTILVSKWQAVEALAAAVIEKKELSGEEVDKIINKNLK